MGLPLEGLREAKTNSGEGSLETCSSKVDFQGAAEGVKGDVAIALTTWESRLTDREAMIAVF
jgi:hypothetical protein